ncbi:MAG: hypothetical protein IPK53_07040 [bacterium]|nr:hypothetical protein [bacterium]
MKQRVATLLLMLIFCSALTRAASAAMQQQPHVSWERVSRSEWQVRCVLPALRMDSVSLSGSAWSALSAAPLAVTNHPGEPALPFFTVWIPAAVTMSEIQIVERAPRLIECAPPLPSPQPLDRGLQTSMTYLPSEEVYGHGAPYPAETHEIVQQGSIGRAPMTLVQLYPVRYWAAQGGVLVQDTMVMRISLANGRSLDDNTQFSRYAETFVSQLVPIQLPENPPQEMVEPRLWIVTAPEYVEVLAEWRQFKRSCGIPSDVFIASEVATSAAALRDFLRTRFESVATPPEFLLIVGDFDAVPAFYGVSSSLTDHPYSCLAGPDYLPDLSVGRLPVHTNAELSAWIARALDYEFHGNVGPGNATVFASSVALDPEHGEQIHTLFSGAGLTTTALQQPQSGALPLLLNSLNAEPLWTFYIGHGTVDRWSSVAPHLTATGLASIQNARVGVVVSVACATADFDEGSPSLAEAWNVQQLQGALCYIGATESTAFFYSDTIGLATVEAAFSLNFDYLGHAFDFGKMRCAESFPQLAGGLTEETIQQFVLLGDPSLRPYTASPLVTTVELPNTVPIGTTHVPITVRRNNVPAANAEVTLSSPAWPPRQVRTDADGFALIELPATTAHRWSVMVRGHNLLPSEHTVDVIPVSGPLVQVQTLEITDPNGDADGRPDRGESGLLRVLVRNNGSAAAPAASLRIECSTPAFTLVPQLLTSPALFPQTEEWLESAATFTVSDSVQDGTTAVLQFWNGTDHEAGFAGSVSLRLDAPSVVVTSQTLREWMGDSDGEPEAGEQLALELVVANRGQEVLRSPVADCFPDHDYLHIDSTRWTGRDLLPGQMDTLRYTFRCHSNTPRGYAFEYNIALSADNQPVESFWGSHRISRIPALLYVLDSQPQQVNGVEATLAALGIEFVRSSTLPNDLSSYASIWIFCGVHPNQEPLPAEHAQRIAEYLDDGGACYWEGGDVWSFDNPTNLHPYFGIDGLADGTGDAGPVAGVRGRFTEGMNFLYNGENSFIDRITAMGSAENILTNGRSGAEYALCVANSGTTYRTVGSSIEIGALIDASAPSRRIDLIRSILNWFDIPVLHDLTPPVITHLPLNRWFHDGRPIPITCDVQDDSELDMVACDYRINGGAPQTTELTYDGAEFAALLPAQPYGTTIAYRLRAADRSTPQNTTVTDEFVLTVEWYQDRAVQLFTPGESLSRLRKRGASGTVTLVNLGPAQQSLVLIGDRRAQTCTFVTDVLDLSTMLAPELSFCSVLSGRNAREPVVARVLGSTDGGATFPHLLWRSGGATNTAEAVRTEVLKPLIGQTNVVVKFVYYADRYWEVAEPTLTEAAAQPEPVRNLVVRPGEVISLHWRPADLPGSYYRISAAPDLLAPFEPIALVQDTFYQDADWGKYAQRFYRVETVPPAARRPMCVSSATHSYDRVARSFTERSR